MVNKILISYFYQIRNFTNNMVPISTALSDPKWYHDNKGKDNIFFDKNDVLIGLRYDALAPGPECQDLCRGKDGDVCDHNPNQCEFIKKYREQLNKLDINKLLEFINNINDVMNSNGLNDTIIPVLIVHEAPTNPCSERVPLMEWIRSHGIECGEFR